MQLIAKFAGKCIKTGARILPGDLIEFHGRGRAVLISRKPAGETLEPLPRPRKWISSYFRSFDGREYYRNNAGRCEDAPCCGCCNY